jgi:hypothetical protein
MPAARRIVAGMERNRKHRSTMQPARSNWPGPKNEKEIRMKHLLVAATVTAALWLATPASADPFFVSRRTPDGLLGALPPPASTGDFETETARLEHVTCSEVTRLVNNRGVDVLGLAPSATDTPLLRRNGSSPTSFPAC